MMHAVVLSKNQVLEYREVPQPALLDDECRIRIAAAGVCSSDIARAYQSGAYHYPLIMGHEMSGEIVELGKKHLREFKPGDRVSVFPLLPCHQCSSCQKRHYALCKNYDYYGSRRDGAFAEFLNVKFWNLLRIPTNVSNEAAALLEPLSVSVQALRKTGLLVREKSEAVSTGEVAILGAGFLGIACAKILRLRQPDLRITLLDRNSSKVEQAKASSQVDAFTVDTNEDWERFSEKNRSRFSTVIEACGNPETFQKSIELTAEHGTVVWMGNPSSNVSFPKSSMSSILRKELRIYGTWNSFYDPEMPNDWTEALQLLSEGLDLSSLITNRISLETLPIEMDHLFSHKTRRTTRPAIKTVVVNSRS